MFNDTLTDTPEGEEIYTLSEGAECDDGNTKGWLSSILNWRVCIIEIAYNMPSAGILTVTRFVRAMNKFELN